MNVKIFKVRDFLCTVLHSIDFFNKRTNDAFYRLPYEDVENTFLVKEAHEENKEDIVRQQIYFSKKELYPYLLVNIRSGSTFIRVNSPTEHVRVSGTALGGSTINDQGRENLDADP